MLKKLGLLFCPKYRVQWYHDQLKEWKTYDDFFRFSSAVHCISKMIIDRDTVDKWRIINIRKKPYKVIHSCMRNRKAFR